MRHIQKGQEPTELLAYRKAHPAAPFDDLGTDTKRAVRDALRDEQANLCCYCTGRLKPGLRIEHWAPQSRYPERALQWTNLLLACHGTSGLHQRHCDVSKADTEIDLRPTANPERHLSYLLATGKLDGRDAAATRDIGILAACGQTARPGIPARAPSAPRSLLRPPQRASGPAFVGSRALPAHAPGAGLAPFTRKLLGLNVAHLRDARRRTLDGVQEAIDRTAGHGKRASKGLLEKQLRHWRSSATPHAGIVVQWLERRLKR